MRKVRQMQADDDLIRWSALSEPGDRLAGAIYRNRPELTRGDLRWMTSSNAISSALDDARFAPYLHSANALAERVELRLPATNVAHLLDKAAAAGAFPVPFQGLPQSLRQSFARLGDSQPLLLWVAGKFEALKVMPRLGFVGTRIPSAYSERIVCSAISSFSSDCCVISGGAVGVDAIAHRAALEVDLPTVAFLAGGVDRLYPESNAGLFREIVASAGALVSEVPPGTAPTRWRFLQRNRLIAAACDLLVVTEAGIRSGARNTVHHANECGVRVMIVPGAIDSEASKGTNLMLAEGLGEPLLDPRALETAMLSGSNALGSQSDESADRSEINLGQQAIRVLDALLRSTSLFEIARESGLDTRSVSTQLEQLSDQGLVAREGIRWVRLER